MITKKLGTYSAVISGIVFKFDLSYDCERADIGTPRVRWRFHVDWSQTEQSAHTAYNLILKLTENETAYSNTQTITIKNADSSSVSGNFVTNWIYQSNIVNETTVLSADFEFGDSVVQLIESVGLKCESPYATLTLPEEVDGDVLKLGRMAIFPISYPSISGIKINLKAVFASSSGEEILVELANNTDESKVYWLPELNEIGSLLKNTMRSTVGLRLETVYNETVIAERGYLTTMSVPEYHIKLNSFTLLPNNDNLCLKDWNILVKGFSRLDWSVDAETFYGATITKYEIQIGAKTPKIITTETSGTSDIINELGNNEDGTLYCSIKVTDSRNKNISTSQDMIIHDYNPPVLTKADIYRCTPEGVEDINGTNIYIKCEASLGENSSFNGQNALTLGYKIRKVGDEEWISDVGLTSGEGSIVIDDIGDPISCDILNSYEIWIYVTDSIMIRNTKPNETAIYKKLILSTGKPSFHLGKNGRCATFGKYCDGSTPKDTLESDWNILANKNLDILGDLTVKGKKISQNSVYVNASSVGWIISPGATTVLARKIINDPGIYLCIGSVRTANDVSENAVISASITSDIASSVLGMESKYISPGGAVTCQYFVIVTSANTTIELNTHNYFSEDEGMAFYGQLFCVKLNDNEDWDKSSS